MKPPLLVAHGNLEVVIPVMFIGLPAALLALVFTVLAVVVHLRRKPAPARNSVKSLGIAAGIFWVIMLGSPWMLPVVDFIFEQVMPVDPAGPQAGVARPSDPNVMAAEKIPGLIKKLPDHVGFGYSGAAYYQGKLYVSSNIGMLTVRDRQVESLLQWTSDDAVIEGPWLDVANGALWAQTANDSSLLRFDGLHWTRLSLPEPPAGYTRGDMLSGFGGRSTPRSFWILGGNITWRWEPASGTWAAEALPPVPGGSAVKAFFSWDDTRVFLIREGYQIGIEAGNNPATVHVLGQAARKFAGVDIDARESAQTERSGFVRSSDGRLFAVTREQMTKLDGPGRCEAITTTSKGTLLACFGAAGVFERVDDRWVKRAESPFAPDEGEHWAHLAESNGEIALATSQVPQIVSGTDKFTHSGTAGIWVTVNGKFQRVDSGR